MPTDGTPIVGPSKPSILEAAQAELKNLPPEQLNAGVVAKPGDVGVEVEVNKRLGKGWYAAADASWWKRAGYSIAALVGWKGKDAK